MKESIESMDFTINNDMVKKFAELTGDKSSLHIDPEFARKTRYRDNIAHGMIPVNFIFLFNFWKTEEFALCTIEQMELDFINPIYIPSTIRMNAKKTDNNTDTQKIKIEIEAFDTKNNSKVLKGKILLNHNAEKRAGYQEIEIDTGLNEISDMIISENLKEEELCIDDILPEAEFNINFSMTKRRASVFFSLISQGLNENSDDLKTRNIGPLPLNSIVSANLLSTVIGMKIPGKNATFLGFSINLLKEVPEDADLILKADIAHKSSVTNIIKLAVCIENKENNEKYIEGTASVMVNPPTIMMPSINELQPDIDLNLRDKVVLITGSSRGMGEVMAKMFSLLGSKVIINYYKGKSDAEAIVEEIQKSGGEAVAINADVSDMEQVQKMIDAAVSEYGKIDILVNNAVRDTIPKDFSNLQWEDMQSDIDVIVKGAFNCCRGVLPVMEKQGEGAIVNISTIYTENPAKKQFKYAVAKSAMTGFTRSLAVEYAGKNIRVNMVLPSFVETDLVACVPSAYKKQIIGNVPLKRPASPVDVSHAVIFLSSSYSSYITGQRIIVSGGDLPFL